MSRLPHIVAATAVVRRFRERDAVEITAPISPCNAEPGAWEWDALDLDGDCWRDGCFHGPSVMGCGEYLHVPHKDARTPGAWMENTSDRVRCHWRPGDEVTLRTRNGRHRATARVALVYAERIAGVWCWRLVLAKAESGPEAGGEE